MADDRHVSICGFNAYQVRNGSCERGVKLRTTSIPEIRGSLCVDTIANHVVTITPRRIENFVNSCIQQLALQGIFPKEIHAAYDATLYETTRKFKGCGSVTHKRRVRARGYLKKRRTQRGISHTLYGCKIWAIYEIKTGIPPAVKIDTIEKPDNLHILAVLEQAKEHVAESSAINSLVIDRGFLDGKALYEIDD